MRGARAGSGSSPGGRRRLAITLLLATLGIGCATPSDRPADGEGAAALGERREAGAAALDTFRVRGGLGVWDDERSVTARIDWRQRGASLDLGLVAPLGLGTARLIRNEGGARLVRGDAAPITGASADEVLRRALGLAVPVPLEQLGAWLRGLPGDGRDVRRDAAGRLESLRWRDPLGTSWQARVLDWTRLGGLELPSLMTARGGGYRMRLVLRDWSADLGEGAFGAGIAGDDADEGSTPEAPAAPGRAGGPRRLPIPTR